MKLADVWDILCIELKNPTGGFILKKLFLYFILGLTAIFGQTIFAQNTPMRPLPIVPSPVPTPLPEPDFIKMNVPGQDDKSSVRLSELSCNVEIIGNVAVTTLDMIFVNDSNRVLEGEFEFPLGQNEFVTGYALDINGKMRKGVVVEKDKGRQVFEAVVRQGIDPGLVEMTAGNNFKTRVYPLPAKGSRHVQLTYQSELKTAQEADSSTRADITDNSKLYYKYNALSSQKLDSFNFTITLLDENKTDSSSKIKSDIGGSVIDFSNMNSGYTANFSKKNYALTKPFTIALPKNDNSQNQKFFTQNIGKDTYFYAAVPAYNSEQKSNTALREKKLPQNLVVWWDISSSGEKRDLQKELSLLEFYVSLLKNPTVTIVPFCNELHEAIQFKGNSKASLKEMADFIKTLEYDGATKLDYDFAELFAGDEVLVFTDGIANWNNSTENSEKVSLADSKKEKKSVNVTTINSSVIADHAFLQNLAGKNGGIYINLAENSTENALKLMQTEHYHLISVIYDGKAIEEVYPLSGEIAGTNGLFAITGKLRRKEARIELNFGFGSTVVNKIALNVNVTDGIPCEYIAKFHAQKKINALSLNYEQNKTKITELAKKFGIVTKDTSLIVLDNVQDYIRYGIVPPDELLDEYNRLIQNSGTFKPNSDGTDNSWQVPKSVYNTFNEFRKWWNKNPKDFRKDKNKEKWSGIGFRLMGNAADEAMLYDAEPVYEDSAMAEDSVQFRQEALVTNSMRQAAAPESPALNSDGTNGSDNGNSEEAKIQLTAWSPDVPYLSILKNTDKTKMYKRYLELKKEYGSSPAFYMEVSDYFAEEELEWQSIRILSNLAELNLENTDVLRALGNKLIERKLYVPAVPVFQKLVQLKGEVPQFYRDLGLALYYAGEYQKAVDTLYSAVCREWDNRFAEVQQILLNDMNAIIADAKRNKINLDLSRIDDSLIENFDVDLRIVLTWNTDDCDIDLWVTDKDKEKCFYGNRITQNGGRISHDFTGGYGPEEFCIKHNPGGKFTIEVNYFANHQQKLLQPITVQAEVYTNFGRKNQKREVLTLQLDSVKTAFLVGEVE